MNNNHTDFIGNQVLNIEEKLDRINQIDKDNLPPTLKKESLSNDLVTLTQSIEAWPVLGRSYQEALTSLSKRVNQCFQSSEQ